MPETKQAARPLSYYMRNGLWYFTQPPDTISGQVIPKSTVEQWLEKTLELEAEITRLREQVDQRLTVDEAMEAFRDHCNWKLFRQYVPTANDIDDDLRTRLTKAAKP
jgi:hypothetical protein